MSQSFLDQSRNDWGFVLENLRISGAISVPFYSSMLVLFISQPYQRRHLVETVHTASQRVFFNCTQTKAIIEAGMLLQSDETYA